MTGCSSIRTHSGTYDSTISTEERIIMTLDEPKSTELREVVAAQSDLIAGQKELINQLQKKSVKAYLVGGAVGAVVGIIIGCVLYASMVSPSAGPTLGVAGSGGGSGWAMHVFSVFVLTVVGLVIWVNTLANKKNSNPRGNSAS
jgi:hypothetical protein